MSQSLSLPASSTLSHWLAQGRSVVLPLVIITLVLLMVIPIPAMMLDVFFIMNITISLIVLMLALNSYKPLDFSAFPTVLLFTTLFRLALNVASTRVVLVNGHTGKNAAGHVIEAFGDFIIGGNFIVGLFVFAILVIINLVVITKGAGRVSEVSARFTLDALPGKQMAIDADLNAGLLTADEAKQRRQDVASEADFYGSMDGASKFVKGDAVAALLILIINVVGGLILGTVKHDLGLGAAAEIYIILAVGDALVAQIPSLLLSIAAASIVTRVSSSMDLTGQLASQFSSASAWAPVAGMLALLGILPGMPHLVILCAAMTAGGIAFKLSRTRMQATTNPLAVSSESQSAPDIETIQWEDICDDTIIGLELGFGLLGLIDERQPAPLIGRLSAIRRQLSRELGFVVPNIRVRDNLSLAPCAYRLILGGAILGEDEVSPGELLALESGSILHKISGRAVKDPTYGLDAVWIMPGGKQEAISAGYTVVDPGTVIATHLSNVLQKNARLLLGQDAVQKMLDVLQVSAPQLIAGLVPKSVTLQNLTITLQTLLDEKLSLKEFRTIAEAISLFTHRSQDPQEIAEFVRPVLGALFVQRLSGLHETLKIFTFDHELERLLTASVRSDMASDYPFDPKLSEQMVAATAQAVSAFVSAGAAVAIVTTPVIRRAVYRVLRQHVPELAVLSFYEIPDEKTVEVVGIIGSTTTSNDQSGMK